MTCAFPGCARPLHGSDLCHSHYTQRRRGRPLVPLRRLQPRGTLCQIDGCPRKHKGHGLCDRHLSFSRTFNLTIEQIDRVWALRARGCAICGRTENLAYDHCHETGEFREWLCGQCNTAVGLMGDDPVRIEAAAAYLRRHKEYAL